MNIIPRFEYQTLRKVTYTSGSRHYICPITGNKLPSVTTILDATASEKKELVAWRQRIGDLKADQIKKESAALGTLMHAHLENHILGVPRPGGNNTARIMAEKMADKIIEHGLVNVDEVYGNEVHLYVPGLCAGTCDGIARIKGRFTETIIDFKTARKMRTRNMIDDYMVQIAGYATCHDELYHTEISQGIIFMVDRDYNFKEFVIEGAEFKQKKLEFLDRVEKFYASGMEV